MQNEITPKWVKACSVLIILLFSIVSSTFLQQLTFAQIDIDKMDLPVATEAKDKLHTANEKIIKEIMKGYNSTLPLFMSQLDESNGVLIIGIYFNATEPLDVYKERLRLLLGPNIPFKVDFGFFKREACTFVDVQCDPLIGGIEVEAPSLSIFGPMLGTLSLPVVNSDGIDGFIMSSHVADDDGEGETGQVIKQPSGNSSRNVGTVITNPRLLDNNHVADAAFVQADVGIGLDNKSIFNSSNDTFYVLSKKESNEIEPSFTDVNLIGAGSIKNGARPTGVVTGTGLTVWDPFFGTLLKQASVTYTNVNSTGGDSGGPIISIGDKDIYFYGIHVGQVCFGAQNFNCTGGIKIRVFSPWEGIREELNLAGVKNITQISTAISPNKTNSYEGEKRTFLIKDVIYTFYYNGSSIKYKTSSDGGANWSNESSLSTGALASDSYRWSVVYTTYQGTTYIYVLYWVPGNPTTSMYFYFKRGTVNSDGSSVSWSSPVELGYTAAHSNCGTGGACASAVAATDSNGIIFAAFRYKPGGQNNYYFSIKYSNNGGFDWYDSWGHSDIGSTYPPTMALTKLDSGRMLWAYSFYNTNTLYFKVYVPNEGWYSYYTTITGWPTSGNKQISADADPTTNKAYIALVSNGTSGGVKVARFSSNGTLESIETPPTGNLSHSLPSIVITSDGVVRIFTIADSKIYETKKVGTTWIGPSIVFGENYQINPDQLTSAISEYSALWKEGNIIRFPSGYN